MNILRLIIYIIGIVCASVGIAMFPYSHALGFVILVVALTILTFLGWGNILYAMQVGIVAADPTENIPEGEGNVNG
jgi:hypothetical protein